MDCFLVQNGGGTSLNFKVVGNPQPSNPKENTIWLNTDVPIGAWYFGATQPENLNESDVWFSVGTSSPVEFNALKKNGIQVYPLSAKQYVSGALVGVEAKSYQGGEWVDWIFATLFDSDTPLFEIAGGYVAEAKQFSSNVAQAGVPTVEIDGNTVKLHGGKDYGASGIVRTKEKIDLSKCHSLKFNGTIPNSGELGLYGIFVWTDIGTYITDNVVASLRSTNATLEGECSIPLDNVNGSYYIGFAVRDQGASIVVERMVLA